MQQGRTQGIAGTLNAKRSLIGNTIERGGRRSHDPERRSRSFASARIAESYTESRWLRSGMASRHGFHAMGRTVCTYERILDKEGGYAET